MKAENQSYLETLCNHLNSMFNNKPLVVRNGYLFSERQIPIKFELFVDENAITLKYPFRKESEELAKGVSNLLNNAIQSKKYKLEFVLRKHHTQPKVYYYYWDLGIKDKSIEEVGNLLMKIQNIEL